MKKEVLNKENNPGKARWCEQHQHLECTKNRTKGRGPCHKIAIRGTDACDMHAGKKRELAKIQGEARITAWSPHGEKIKLDAGMAVLGVLQMTWLRLGSYSELLRRQVATERDIAEDPSEVDSPSQSGLIGYRYGAAGKDGVVYVQSEEVRALVALEAAERDRVVKYAKTAHDMGISERITGLAEKWGDIVAMRVATMLDALNLTPEQQAMVPTLVESHLGAIDVEEMAGENP